MKILILISNKLATSALLMIIFFSLSECGEEKATHIPTLEEEPSTPCAAHELVGAAFINQAATLARDETFKTYTLTFSPVADSTVIGIICDTSAYDLSALLGHVRFHGKLRAAGQDVPQPAAGQAYYSLELDDAPIKEAICTARAFIAEVTDQPATLARDETFKTYTLTFSPVADSTVIGIVCDTTAYDLGALVGQVRFHGRLRAAGQDVPQPAAGQAYYSLELKGVPIRQEFIGDPPPKKPKTPLTPQQQKLIGKWQLVEQSYGVITEQGPTELTRPVKNGPHVQFNTDLTYSSSWIHLACTKKNGKISGNGNFSFSKTKEKLLLNITYIIEDCDTSQDEYSIDKLFKYDFEEGCLILLNLGCFEGCSYRFKKLKK